MQTPDRVTFAWWNLRDFAHHDPARVSLARWPKEACRYEVKRDRILTALGGLTAQGFPDLIAVCEITREASTDLLSHLPNDFKLLASPESPSEDDFQVAIFHRDLPGLSPQLPLIASDTANVTRSTRPMLAIHLGVPGHVLRFVACHWTGMDEASARAARVRLAEFLRSELYEFLCPEARDGEASRHVIVLGDLNEEPPHNLFTDHLPGHRDRMSSRQPHWRDQDVRRVRLYNLAWRFLGEQHPHGPDRPLVGGAVGTYYSEKQGWRTYDHVLVSGGLLGDKLPMIDEEKTRIVNLPVMRDDRGRPIPFVSSDKNGISNHLPIVGQILLPGSIE